MHYIHTLSERQKRLIILLFIIVPIVVFGLLIGVWANKRGMFKKMVFLKTTIKSAQGVDPSSRVTFSGIEIGKVEKIKLLGPDAIEVVFKIQKEFNPLVQDGDALKAVDQLDAENLMAKLSPVVDAAERIVLKIDKITASIPEQKINSSITDVAGILNDVKTGKATVGKLVSTDKGELAEKVNELIQKINHIAKKAEEATARLPETMNNVADLTKSATSVTKDLEREKTIQAVLKNLNRVLEDIDKMAPAIHKSVENAGNILGDSSLVTKRVPALMDDVEQTLNDTMLMIQGLKTGWPVNKFVPSGKDKQVFEPTLREPPQPATK